MPIKRRDFIKLVGAASAAILPEMAGADTERHDAIKGTAYGVLVDTTVCIGCRKCELACDRQNKLTDAAPSRFENKDVITSNRRPSSTAYTVITSYRNPKAPDGTSFMKVQCMHCNAPACVSACIVGALTKCEHGAVTYDASRCIGCRYCMVACPFQIPAYEYDRVIDPRVMKCTFCSERIHGGERPACVSACPAEALTFGKRDDLIDLARTKLATDPQRYVNRIYGENEVGGTSWIYLAGVDFAATSLPRLPTDPIPHKTESIQHGIFKSFMPPIALYALLGLVMHSMRKDDDRQEASE